MFPKLQSGQGSACENVLECPIRPPTWASDTLQASYWGCPVSICENLSIFPFGRISQAASAHRLRESRCADQTGAHCPVAKNCSCCGSRTGLRMCRWGIRWSTPRKSALPTPLASTSWTLMTYPTTAAQLIGRHHVPQTCSCTYSCRTPPVALVVIMESFLNSGRAKLVSVAFWMARKLEHSRADASFLMGVPLCSGEAVMGRR